MALDVVGLDGFENAHPKELAEVCGSGLASARTGVGAGYPIDDSCHHDVLTR